MTVYAVLSGARGEASVAAGQSAVTVYTETLRSDACGVNYSYVGTFTNTDTQGPLSITAASGRWLSLSSPPGQLQYFDLTADQFATSTSASG